MQILDCDILIVKPRRRDRIHELLATPSPARSHQQTIVLTVEMGYGGIPAFLFILFLP